MKEHIAGWVTFITGAVISHINDIIGITVLFLLLFVVDFFSGCAASICKKKELRSYKFRWSFVKTFCYGGTFFFTYAFGILRGQEEFFEPILNVQIYVAAYIECVSILENMMVIFPGNLFFKYLHYMLTVQWIKKISGLKEAIKEHKKD